MNLFDYLILTIILCSVIISVFRGLVTELISLSSWIIAFYVANIWCQPFSEVLPNIIPGQITKIIASFMIIFVFTRMLLILVAKALQTLVKASGLGFADRMLGAFFGFLRGVFFVLVGVMLAGMTKLPSQTFWRDSFLGSWIVDIAKWFLPLMPDSITKYIQF